MELDSKLTLVSVQCFAGHFLNSGLILLQSEVVLQVKALIWSADLVTIHLLPFRLVIVSVFSF